jgi:phosphomannomutase/phosphoglucomutase
MPNLPDNIFRGYDIRGIQDIELTPELYYVLAKAYSTFLLNRQITTCVVGMDNRLTSPSYKKEFVRGLLSSRITVYDIGMVITPMLYFAQYHFNSKGGAMITASHNPKEYNGLKLASGFSETLGTDEIQEIKKIALNQEFKEYAKEGVLIKKEIFSAYKEELFKRVPQKFGFKVVVDTAYGTAGKFIPDILKDVGCNVVEQYTELDGSYPLGTPDPTSVENQSRLAKRVVQEKADLGLGFDGDGDRLGVVDSEGKIIYSDLLVAIFAQDVLSRHPKAKIVFNAFCSKTVLDTIIKAAGQPVMWKTGHSFIKAKVKEENAPFGGEFSGHFFFMDNFYGHDDPAFATLRLLSILKERNKSLATIINELPSYMSSPQITIPCPDAVKFELMSEKIIPEVKSLFPNAQYTTIDGIRVDTQDEMLIIRASHNGPYLTARFEARRKEDYERLRLTLRQILEKHSDVLDLSTAKNL